MRSTAHHPFEGANIGAAWRGIMPIYIERRELIAALGSGARATRIPERRV
jgi:hypothetical protein